MSLFQTLLRPDREEHPERALVARAANLLQIGEFQMLQLAFRAEHGRDMPEDFAGKLFDSFMVRNEVPRWALDYARRILELDAQGRLDDNDPAFHYYDHDYVTHVPDGVKRFIWATLALVFVLGGGLWFSTLTVKDATSILPPYFEKSELEARD